LLGDVRCQNRPVTIFRSSLLVVFIARSTDLPVWCQAFSPDAAQVRSPPQYFGLIAFKNQSFIGGIPSCDSQRWRCVAGGLEPNAMTFRERCTRTYSDGLLVTECLNPEDRLTNEGKMETVWNVLYASKAGCCSEREYVDAGQGALWKVKQEECC
jgi:hypothetical protein